MTGAAALTARTKPVSFVVETTCGKGPNKRVKRTKLTFRFDDHVAAELTGFESGRRLERPANRPAMWTPAARSTE